MSKKKMATASPGGSDAERDRSDGAEGHEQRAGADRGILRMREEIMTRRNRNNGKTYWLYGL